MKRPLDGAVTSLSLSEVWVSSRFLTEINIQHDRERIQSHKHTACGQILTLLTETSNVHPKHEETTRYMLLNKASLRYSVTFNGN